MSEIHQLPSKPSRAWPRVWTAGALAVGAVEAVMSFTGTPPDWTILLAVNGFLLLVVVLTKMQTGKDVQTLADTIARIAEARR